MNKRCETCRWWERDKQKSAPDSRPWARCLWDPYAVVAHSVRIEWAHDEKYPDEGAECPAWEAAKP